MTTKKPSETSLSKPPQDDGSCSHLKGKVIPSASLRSTDGSIVDVARLAASPLVLFFLTRVWRPPLEPTKAWRILPGALGGEVQTCGFRDLHDGFSDLGVRVLGVGSQPIDDLVEIRNRRSLPFELLCDERFLLTEALVLPTFHCDGNRWIRRLTLFLKAGKIAEVIYPVHPPELNAQALLTKLSEQSRA